LNDLGRIFKERDEITKVAQVTNPSNGQEKQAIHDALEEFQKNPAIVSLDDLRGRAEKIGDSGLVKFIEDTKKAYEGQAKTADAKLYDVFGKQNIVHDAHPQTAYVNGDVVETVEEAQKIDIGVAQKESTGKQVVAELYNMAKQLKADKNDVAYKLVRATCVEIAKLIK
jgi:hypothetical protein